MTTVTTEEIDSLIETIKIIDEHPLLTRYISEYEDVQYLNAPDLSEFEHVENQFKRDDNNNIIMETEDSNLKPILEFYNLIQGLYLKLNGYLIDSKGQPNFKAMFLLKTYSEYYITCGEKDSFGWLSGVLNAKNFKYVYG